MLNFKEKLENLYYYEEWDFSTLYGFYINFNHLMKPYFLSYDHFENIFKEYKMKQLNCDSKGLQQKLLDMILENKEEKDFTLKRKI